jgi:hypothetical protein
VEVDLAHRATGTDLRSQVHRARQFADVALALARRLLSRGDTHRISRGDTHQSPRTPLPSRVARRSSGSPVRVPRPSGPPTAHPIRACARSLALAAPRGPPFLGPLRARPIAPSSARWRSLRVASLRFSPELLALPLLARSASLAFVFPPRVYVAVSSG